jgi:hypothetical protein
VEKRNIISPCQKSNPRSFTIQPIACQFTDNFSVNFTPCGICLTLVLKFTGS